MFEYFVLSNVLIFKCPTKIGMVQVPYDYGAPRARAHIDCSTTESRGYVLSNKRGFTRNGPMQRLGRRCRGLNRGPHLSFPENKEEI